MALTLLKYPLPTEKMVTSYESGLGKLDLEFVEFLKVPSWMDKFDERMIDDLAPETPYRTIFYKKLLFWIFRTESGLIHTRKFISALRVFQFDGRRTKTFFEWMSEGVPTSCRNPY